MRILIVKLSSLGDLFHALPTVHALRLAYPGCTIDWVTHAAYQSLVACFSDVDHVIPYPRQNARQQGLRFLRELRQQHYDLVLDLQGLLKSALVARLARSTKRIGPSFCREGSHLFHDAVAGPRNLDRHAVDQILDVTACLHLPPTPIVFPLKFPVRQRPDKHPQVVLAPVSRWPAKNWPAERFAETAHQLQARYKASITLIGAPGDAPVCADIASALSGKCHNLAGRTNLPEMGSVLQSADLLIANDSGPVHMAAALGLPTVVIFGPTNPRRIGPYGRGHQVLLPPTPCLCGRTRICKHPQKACIKEITVAAVVRAATESLQRTHPEKLQALARHP